MSRGRIEAAGTDGEETISLEVELTKPGRKGPHHRVSGTLHVTAHTGEDVVEELFTAAIVNGWTISMERVRPDGHDDLDD